MTKRLIGLLMILTMIISLVSVPDTTKAATKSYLVLIETKDGKWDSSKDLAYASGDNLMVKAYSTSKALGLTYKNNDKTLTIQNGKQKLTLSKNSKSYEYYNGSSFSKKTASYKTYAAKISKTSTYVVHYGVLENLVSTFYFKGSDKTAYKNYAGVICYSLSDNDLTLTDIPTKVPTFLPTTNTPKPTKAPEKDSNKDDVSYNGTVTIGGVEIPKLTGFADDALDSGYWGADNHENGERSLKDAIDAFSDYVHDAVSAVGDESNQSGLGIGIDVTDFSIDAVLDGDSTMSPLKLKKSPDGYYEIYINVRLSKAPEGQSDYSTIIQNTLKCYCYIISSTANILYSNIYKDAEEDAFLSETNWTIIGDCQVKVRTEGTAVIYMIKAK